jgi:hypothetical protein
MRAGVLCIPHIVGVRAIYIQMRGTPAHETQCTLERRCCGARARCSLFPVRSIQKDGVETRIELPVRCGPPCRDDCVGIPT